MTKLMLVISIVKEYDHIDTWELPEQDGKSTVAASGRQDENGTESIEQVTLTTE